MTAYECFPQVCPTVRPALRTGRTGTHLTSGVSGCIGNTWKHWETPVEEKTEATAQQSNGEK